MPIELVSSLSFDVLEITEVEVPCHGMRWLVAGPDISCEVVQIWCQPGYSGSTIGAVIEGMTSTIADGIVVHFEVRTVPRPGPYRMAIIPCGEVACFRLGITGVRAWCRPVPVATQQVERRSSPNLEEVIVETQGDAAPRPLQQHFTVGR